jgi:hypothetical protein
MSATETTIGYIPLKSDLILRDREGNPVYELKQNEWATYSEDKPLTHGGFSFNFAPVSHLQIELHDRDIWEVEVTDITQVVPAPGIHSWGVSTRIKLVRKFIAAEEYEDKVEHSGNTGWYNYGKGNTGHCNYGVRNSGSHNTGSDNTGNRNLGHSNIGDYNIGSYNVGSYNLASDNSGFFAIEEPNILCFGVDSGLKIEAFMNMYYVRLVQLYSKLTEAQHDLTLLVTEYAHIPGVTLANLTAWRERYFSLLENEKQRLKQNKSEMFLHN